MNTKQLKGFAAMDSIHRKEMASKGGKAAQAKGVGHHFTIEEAQAAGRRGGLKRAENRRKKLAAEDIVNQSSTSPNDQSHSDVDQPTTTAHVQPHE